MSVKYERQPLEISAFPPNLQNHVKPEAPPPLKMMAARGMVPAPPEFAIRVLYQLSYDPDMMVKTEAANAVKEMPPHVLVPSLQSEQPAAVLDWVAELRARDDEIVEAVLLNRGADDLTVAAMAATVNTRICDVIANNQVRILRSPVILEQLYQNPNARMATVDKLIDLAHRNNIELKGLPSLQAALESGEDLGLALDEGTEALEAGFDSLLQEEAVKAAKDETEEEEEDTRPSRLTRRQRERRQDEDDDESKPLFARLQGMSIAQKIRLASIGGREAAVLLVKESNRLVHMAAIQNPRLKYNDIKKLASNKSVSDGVIRYIANNREWTKHYDVILSLVNNPKTPMADTLSFLVRLRTNDLRQITRNRNVPGQVSRQAKILVNKRGGGG